MRAHYKFPYDCPSNRPGLAVRASRAIDRHVVEAPVIDDKRVAAERQGRIAEWIAAAVLVMRGYRILARRLITSAGEIDIVAVRGSRLAFVEVKQRATWADADAALRARQTQRLYRAAATFVAHRPFYRNHTRAFDAVFVVPRALPSYVRDALEPDVNTRVWTWG